MAAWMFRHLDEDFRLFRMNFFFKSMSYMRMRQVLFFLMQLFTLLKIYNNRKLKLSAVILAPTGTVYMLLCNEGRHSEEQRQFDW